MPGSVIVGGARTPIGKFQGTLRDVPATELGASAIRAAVEPILDSGVLADWVSGFRPGRNRLTALRHGLLRQRQNQVPPLKQRLDLVAVQVLPKLLR